MTRQMNTMKNETLIEIAQKYGTPSYVFDTKALQERMQKIAEIVGEKVKLCYSIKANPFLIPAMLEAVPHLEVCSPGELAICERLQVPMEAVVYSGVNKEPSDVLQAVRDGVGICTAESLRHVRLLQAAAKEAGKKVPVLLRLNSGAQFGMSKEDLLTVIRNRRRYPDLVLEGIHYFAGTQRKNKDLHQQKEELRMLKELFCEIRETEGFSLRKLEYGPGLPVPLFEGADFSDTLAPVRELAPALKEAAQWADLTVEAGRFFATECGYYITKVVDSKTVEEKKYCIVDGGINHVNYLGQIMGMKQPVIRHFRGNGDPDADPESVKYCVISDTEPELQCESSKTGGKAVASGTAVSAKERAGKPAAVQSESEEEKTDWAICGSLCTTNDDLVRSRRMEEPLPGDLLVFENIGAYSVTEGIYLFLSRKMPRIVLYNDISDICLARDFVDTSCMNTIQGKQNEMS